MRPLRMLAGFVGAALLVALASRNLGALLVVLLIAVATGVALAAGPVITAARTWIPLDRLARKVAREQPGVLTFLARVAEEPRGGWGRDHPHPLSQSQPGEAAVVVAGAEGIAYRRSSTPPGRVDLPWARVTSASVVEVKRALLGVPCVLVSVSYLSESFSVLLEPRRVVGFLVLRLSRRRVEEIAARIAARTGANAPKATP